MRTMRTVAAGLLLLVMAGCTGDDAADTADQAAEGADRTTLDDTAGTETEAAGAGAAADLSDPAEPPATGRRFVDHGTNPFVRAADDPRSTFALDVDTASFTVTREAIDAGRLPDPASVRVEEHVNAIARPYPDPGDGTFGLHLDAAPSPFSSGTMLRVGLQSRSVDEEGRPDAVLTFVVDTSGSMAQGDKMAAVKDALRRLVGSLRPTDTVTIVAYDDAATRVLPPTTAAEPEAILDAIDVLEPAGSTNLDAGLTLGYAVALGSHRPDAVNRVVLTSDGVANVGTTDWEGILRRVQGAVDRDVQLVTVGVGTGEFNDHLLEQLADNGDGFYAYVDTPAEAERLFSEDLTATLLTLADDARIQVTFDAATVERYRLVGFENRAMADEDFRDDDVDAGDVGAGHTVTALYEVVLRPDASGPLATVALRWLDPATGGAQELTAAIDTGEVAATFDRAAPELRLAATAAGWAEVLRGSTYLEGVTLADVAGTAEALLPHFVDEPEVTAWVDLVTRSSRLAGG